MTSILGDAGGLSAGQGKGINWKAIIPAAVASGIAGSIGGDDINWGDAVAAFGQGVAGSKLQQALEKRKRDNEQGDFLIKKAYEDVDALAGSDISGIDVPEGLKTRLAELHQKANEARMNDGIVTPKEAQELIALAAPIKSALAEAKTQQASPAAQAKREQEAALARFVEQARLTQQFPFTEETSGPEGGESVIYDSPEALGKARFARDLESKDVVYDEQMGWIPRKEAIRIRENRLNREAAAARAERALSAKVAGQRERISAILLRAGIVSARERDRVAAGLVRDAIRGVMSQNNAQGDGPLSSEEIFAQADTLLKGQLERIGGGTLGDGQGGRVPIPVTLPKAEEWERGPDGKLRRKAP